MRSIKNLCRKKIILFLSGFLCFLLIFLSLLPWFLSTDTGKNILISSLNSRFSGSLKIETLSLTWQGPQKIEKIRFDSIDGKIKLSCEKISCNSSLIKTLLPSHDLGLILVQNPDIEIHQTLIQAPIEKRPQVQIASFSPTTALNTALPSFEIPFIGNLEIQKGKLSIFSENTSPIIFDITHSQLLSNKNLSEISLSITGETFQNNIKGNILVNASFKETNSLNRSLDSTVSLKNFPIDGIDQLLSIKSPEYRSMLTEATGPSLDLNCVIAFSKEACKASLETKSDKLQIQVQTQLKENNISLISPASIQLTLSPRLLQSLQKKFPQIAPFTSKDPIYFLSTFSKLTIPKTDRGIEFKEASFQSNMEIKPYQTSTVQLGGKGTFSSLNLTDEMSTTINIQIAKQLEISNSTVQISCKKPFLKSDQEFIASIEIEKTPVAFIENFFIEPTQLSKLLGHSFKAKARVQGNERKINITSELSSSLLQITKGNFLFENQTLSLTEPLEAHYLITPDTFQSLATQKNIVLQKEAHITALFSDLQLQDFSSLHDLKVKTAITSSPVIFSSFFALKQHSIEDLSLNFAVDSTSFISLHLKSKQFSIQYDGGFDPNSRTLFWKKPIQAQYILTNKELQALYIGKKAATLLQNTRIQIEIDPSTISLTNFSLNRINLTSHIYGETLLFQNANNIKQIELENLETTLKLSGDKDLLDFAISAHVANGKFECQGALKQISSPDFLLTAHLELQQFPLELIDALTDASLTPVLGSLLDLKLSIDKKNTTQSFLIKAKSPFLNMSGGISLNPQSVVLSDSSSPLKIEFLLTPLAYDVIFKQIETSFSLEEDTLFKASLLKLNIPFISSDYKKPDLANLLLNLQIENEQVSFRNKETKKPISLVNTKLSLQKKDEKTPLYLSIDTNTSSSQKGSFHLDAQIKNLLNREGQFHPSNIQSDLIASFQKFPADALEIIFPSKNKVFSNLLGPYFDMTLKTSLHNSSGPLAANLTSKNMKFSLEGELSSGVLTLRQNLLMQISLNSKTSLVFSKSINPLSISSLSSNDPLSIEISAKGFSLPLFPLNLNRIEVPSARITPGKIFCQNEGNINLMLGILKSKQANQTSQLELWFAPLIVHIQKGILDLERTEILVANAYDIALWGRINLPANKVNMTLGLTAPCLKAAFNIQDLPKDYVLHIPLTGTLDNIKLNKSVATSKIVALTLWQSKNITGDLGAGIGGALIGGLLNQVLKPPGNEGATPPAKTPFPWQSEKPRKSR